LEGNSKHPITEGGGSRMRENHEIVWLTDIAAEEQWHATAHLST